MKKFVVWVREDTSVFGWEEQGDGPMSQKEAERIAREIKQDCGVRTLVRPEGWQPGEEG